MKLFRGLRFHFATRLQQPVYTNNIREYYQYLLSSNPMNQRGILKFDNSQISTFVNLTTQEDIKFAIESFTNILGHNATVTSKYFDKFLTKCISYGEIPFVLQCFEHHVTLRYFPSATITEQLIKNCNSDEIKQLLATLKKSLFLKINKELLQSINLTDQEITKLVYQVAQAKKIELDGKIIRECAKAIEEDESSLQQFIIKHTSEDVHTRLAIYEANMRLKQYDQAIVQLAKACQADSNAVKDLDLTNIKEAVKEDETWNQRLNDILVKL